MLGAPWVPPRHLALGGCGPCGLVGWGGSLLAAKFGKVDVCLLPQECAHCRGANQSQMIGGSWA